MPWNRYQLGDPIEVNSIARVYGQNRAVDNPLYLSAVKSNIGHLEGASGIAGIIKVALSLQHKQIAKTLHHHKTNPKIHLDELNGRVVDTTCNWISPQGKLMAAVSSFGATGSNAHAILEEAPFVNMIDIPRELGIMSLC